ncbi:MAG TPA: hypothetical protein VGZ00_04555 [Candidatus Baltobacteraceae bacterium]|nr:hypothetical protein [Candidatus Baltobacteraceae bacterium]
MCDFSGYVEPEIVKLRRVIIISPPNRGAPIALVVPEVWVKADLIAHVRFGRLDRVRIPVLDASGNPIPRKYEYLPTVALTVAHLRKVRQAVLHSLGLGRLAPGV